MNQVTKNKFWRNFTAFAVLASLVGAITSSVAGDEWTAVLFVATTILSSITLAEQLNDEEEEYDDDEQ